jgi:ABC-type lipoprotein release transport system permease subunit
MLVLAVVIGVASLVLVVSLLRGWLDASVDDALEGLTGHVRVHAEGWLDDPAAEHGFRVDPDWLRALDADPEVVARARRIRVPAVIMSERENRGSMLVGIDPAAEVGLSFIGDRKGHGLAGPDDGGLVLGRALAEELETRVGRRVVVMTGGADGTSVERGYRVVGIHDAGGEGRQKAFVFTGRAALAEVLGMDDRVTELSLRLDRSATGADLDARVARLAEAHPGLVVRSWRELVPQVAAMVEISDATIWIWYLVMMAALGFGLVNTLLASVIERVRELGLLQALGMRPSGVLWQVILESWCIVVVGLLTGLAVGIAAVLALADGIDLGRWAAGLEMMGMDRLLVPRMEVADLLRIGLIVLILGLLGSLYPARKAVAIDPLKALNRHQD